MEDISDLRREFLLKTLDESEVVANPILQLEKWIEEALKSEIIEPNAMNLATVSKDGKPSSRIVLLKQLNTDGLIFFTSYESKKAEQINENNCCAANFYWNELERQVRIEGIVEKISSKDSDSYFEVRPEKSKLGAWGSPQSKEIPNRKYLENLIDIFEHKFAGKSIQRPLNWGGYIIKPQLFEFWQGRASRLHDRIQYTLIDGCWKIIRLAP